MVLACCSLQLRMGTANTIHQDQEWYLHAVPNNCAWEQQIPFSRIRNGTCMLFPTTAHGNNKYHSVGLGMVLTCCSLQLRMGTANTIQQDQEWYLHAVPNNCAWEQQIPFIRIRNGTCMLFPTTAHGNSKYHSLGLGMVLACCSQQLRMGTANTIHQDFKWYVHAFPNNCACEQQIPFITNGTCMLIPTTAHGNSKYEIIQ